MVAYNVAIFRNFPQFSTIFPQFFHNFSQLVSTPPRPQFPPLLPQTPLPLKRLAQVFFWAFGRSKLFVGAD